MDMGSSVPPRQGTESASTVQNAPTVSNLPKKRSATSDVWNYFVSLGVGEDGKPRAKCKGCDEVYIAGGSSHGTSSLTRHIPKCSKLNSYHNVGNMLIDHAGKLRSRKISQKVLRSLTAMAIIRHDLPFSFVEYEGVKEMFKYCNPDVKFITRNTYVANVWKVYKSKKESLKQELEGLKVAHDALYKIRESVKYVKGSEGRMRKFEACVKNIGIEHGVFLRLDVQTRWNSTFIMLESALKYRRAFASFQMEDQHYRYCPSSYEWERGEKMCEFLRPFYDITNMISGSTYPTSNIYFTQVWNIECLLIDNANNEDQIIKDMAVRMKEKFDKYWSEYSVVLALRAILDPRMKFPLLERCFNRVDPTTCQSKLDVALMDFDSEIVSQLEKSQLELYLEEAKLEFKFHKDLDVLRYWKDNRGRFPDLSLMAFDILSIPITTVASESAFSIGSRVLNKYRSCLLPEKVQALLCTRNWLIGFNVEGVSSSYFLRKVMKRSSSASCFSTLCSWAASVSLEFQNPNQAEERGRSGGGCRNRKRPRRSSDENAKKSSKLKGGRQNSSSAAINGGRRSSIYRGVTR
ncbi:zinc finger BED domain-containing protein RICESLEEPER 2-like [Senna tora]|uniref:Zinc finger BED domain-containing protein RICESLEEPER 2-like n=1 Tax=Senna tora TaxID=362788 RepID=A0A834SXU2_9FABA|nr:zinc finger BED domain-containing protein RICESLEEPER 2-like [Senna tora]